MEGNTKLKVAGDTSSSRVAIAIITIRTITTIIKQHLQGSRVWSARFFNGLELYDERRRKGMQKQEKTGCEKRREREKGPTFKCWAACERHAAAREENHQRFVCVRLKMTKAPATREEEVIDTFRKGMRDAAEELKGKKEGGGGGEGGGG
jgi:hypothetical protein